MKPNALAAHLRRATHSRRITPSMDHRVKRPMAQDLNVARGPMIPGLGGLGINLNRKLGNHLQSPQPRPIMRSGSRNLGIPIDHRLAAPHAIAMRAAPGNSIPGMGEMDFMPGMGEEGDYMPGMGDLGAVMLKQHAAQSAHRKPILRSVQKPRIKGAPATSRATTSQSFMPGLGEEEDEDVVAFGTLSAAELADGEIPANVAPEAVGAATSGLKTMGLIVGAAFLLGVVLKFR